MEFIINLYGNSENPLVEINGKKYTADRLYKEGPLYAFLLSIPHCIITMFEHLAKKEGIQVKVCKVRSTYYLDDSLLLLGKYVIKNIKIEIYGDCSKEELNELVEKVKQNCPIYLSLSDRIQLLPLID
ncbi:OsmC family peroxiredoxin [Acidianus infernus]|uniref:OsmC family peroxiredoxin n=1 Tax=Acidianus infernus TaxID=12915 RepID=A0A6A9QJN8_ACIIN|nr:OsmC family protein [Acidianus infernus]MCY0882861.1 OsmC family protein [Acidianus infernus]MUM65406.1 OsmC family peroxiredoxin [Acidianus infernus]